MTPFSRVIPSEARDLHFGMGREGDGKREEIPRRKLLGMTEMDPSE